MKKYVKPELFYERYELTEQIADCAWELLQGDDHGGCRVAGDEKNGLGGLYIFTSEDQGCNVLNPSTELYCYTNGAGGYNSFMS